MDITITNSSKEKLDYEFHGDPTDTSLLVIIGHGVTGDKDRPWAVALAKALEEVGINALRFSFAGNGSSEGKFEACTISKEVKDLKASVEKATKLGASVRIPPMEYGDLFFALILDPEGNPIGLTQGS